MLIVENDPAKVEADLAAGRVACPGCGYVLGPWSFARRRFVRAEAGLLEVRPRRARCRECAKTHVLLPDLLLCRRVDVIAVIGRPCRRRRRERAVLERQHWSAVPSRPCAVGCGAFGPRRPG